MMRIDVGLAPGTVAEKEDHGKQFVVIDVLRATSAIITALANGCAGVIPVTEVEEAFAAAASYKGEHEVLLAGERHGLRVDGFHMGNSPLEFIPEKVKGRMIILCTTNGTRVLRSVPETNPVYIGAFLNGPALVERLLRERRDAVLCCAGRKGDFSYEDALCGGYIIDEIIRRNPGIELSDAGKAARVLYRQAEKNLRETILKTEHAFYLLKLGFGADIDFCLQIGKFSFVPVYQEGIIKNVDSTLLEKRTLNKGNAVKK